jgi:predicted GH43/DUF377 family glycosyl hydrolase
MFKILSNPDLIPDSWKVDDNSGFYVFNPAIYRLTDRYAMVYRVINPKDNNRKLATCHLNLDFEPIAGTITPLSDLINQENPDTDTMKYSGWMADARYFHLKGEWYISFNNGMATNPNHQWLMKMDSQCLKPNGRPKEIIYTGKRRPIEKNWMFFESGDQVYCTYSISPHQILKVDISRSDQIVCEPAYKTDWEDTYSPYFNDLRCSTPPVKIEDRFFSVTHSRHSYNGGLHSVCGFYEFESNPPFRVLRHSPRPFTFPGQEYKYTMDPLHKAVTQGIYTCGLIREGEQIILSYGLLNEKSAIAKLNLDSLRKELVDSQPTIKHPFQMQTTQQTSTEPKENGLPLFWWDAKAWAFDRKNTAKKFSIGNFGDTASPFIIEKLAGLSVRQPQPGEAKLISIGSLIHKASSNDVIWGTGMKGNAMKLEEGISNLKVFAVRGPLTLDFLKNNGVNVSSVTEVFDPACLIPVLFKQKIDKMQPRHNNSNGTYRIIPHFRDDFTIRKENTRYLPNILSADCDFLDIIQDIINAQLVISSSLHGIILAECLGISACWLKSPSGEDQLKFRDYYYGTNRYDIKCFDTIDDALKSKPMPLPVFKPANYIQTFPYEEVRKLAKCTDNDSTKDSVILEKPKTPTFFQRILQWVKIS